jgi:hypothetical protein
MKQHVVFTWETNEHMPLCFGFGHGLRLENRFLCESELILDHTEYFMLQKTIQRTDLPNELVTSNHDIRIFLTHKNDDFIRGYLYFNNKEILVLDHRVFQSLQIEKFCFDSISVIKLASNPFTA